MENESNHTINVNLVGSGRVAKFFAYKLQQSGFLDSIYIRSLDQHLWLEDTVYSSKLRQLDQCTASDAKCWILAISDDAIVEVANQIHLENPQTLVLHCSGAFDTRGLQSIHLNSGVLYPLQSFSGLMEERQFQPPLLLSALQASSIDLLKKIAKGISPHIYWLEDEKRIHVHLAAVFVNNFTNLMYHSAYRIMEYNQLDPQILLPLIQQTVEKLKQMHPKDAQTGPALRNDESTIFTHMELLRTYPEYLLDIYRMATHIIQSEIRNK
jgi:predicted short-subunit dehydrogenase-like oxidoreductase (DUF2520 family)